MQVFNSFQELQASQMAGALSTASVSNAVSQDAQQEINSVVRAFRDGVEQIRGKLHQERQQGGNAEHIDRVYVALEKAVSDAGRAAFHAGMEE